MRTHDGQTLDLLASASFVIVDSATTPEEARRRLGELRYAIVVASQEPGGKPEGVDPGQPFALCMAGDLDHAREAGAPTLARSALPATLVMPATLTLGRFVASDAVTLLDLSPHGTVVLGPEIVGVVDNRIVDFHLATTIAPGRTRGPSGSLPDDSVLAGAPQVGVAKVVCGHARCGYVNQLAFYDPGHPPLCQNHARGEHTLVIARK